MDPQRFHHSTQSDSMHSVLSHRGLHCKFHFLKPWTNLWSVLKFCNARTSCLFSCCRMTFWCATLMPQHAIWQPNLSFQDFSKPIHLSICVQCRHDTCSTWCCVKCSSWFDCGHVGTRDAMIDCMRLAGPESAVVIRYDGMTWCCLPTGLGQNANGMPLLRSADLLFFYMSKKLKTFGHGICTICSSGFVMPEVFTSRRGLVWAFESDVALKKALLDKNHNYIPPISAIMVCCVYRIVVA